MPAGARRLSLECCPEDRVTDILQTSLNGELDVPERQRRTRDPVSKLQPGQRRHMNPTECQSLVPHGRQRVCLDSEIDPFRCYGGG